jgi:hypothetical protein
MTRPERFRSARTFLFYGVISAALFAATAYGLPRLGLDEHGAVYMVSIWFLFILTLMGLGGGIYLLAQALAFRATQRVRQRVSRPPADIWSPPANTLMSSSGPHIHGELPTLDGQTCNGLVVEEYWHEGALDIPADAFWLRAESTWYRLSIDHGEVFCHAADWEPTARDLSEVSGSTRLVDLGRDHCLLGDVIAGIDARETEEAVEVVVRFQSGRLVRFRNVGEYTSYDTA